MYLDPLDSSSDYFIDEQQLELIASDLSNPYIAAVMAEQHSLEIFEDIGFQDYIDSLLE